MDIEGKSLGNTKREFVVIFEGILAGLIAGLTGKTKSCFGDGSLMSLIATNNVSASLVMVRLEAILNYCEHVIVDTMGKTTT